MKLLVHELPHHCPGTELAGGIAVVTDILRATTTMAYALAAGATEIMPCAEIDEARSLHRSLAEPTALLVGERGGQRIEGFHLGNSPAEFTRFSVNGRRLIMTTTNGTRALRHATSCRKVACGSFANLSATADFLTEHAVNNEVHILCAGTDGHRTEEDILFAGALVARLNRHGTGKPGNSAATEAAHQWSEVEDGDSTKINELAGRLEYAFRISRGGKNLLKLGMDSDLAIAAQIDRLAVLPVLEASRMVIQAS